MHKNPPKLKKKRENIHAQKNIRADAETLVQCFRFQWIFQIMSLLINYEGQYRTKKCLFDQIKNLTQWVEVNKNTHTQMHKKHRIRLICLFPSSWAHLVAGAGVASLKSWLRAIPRRLAVWCWGVFAQSSVSRNRRTGGGVWLLSDRLRWFGRTGLRLLEQRQLLL